MTRHTEDAEAQLVAAAQAVKALADRLAAYAQGEGPFAADTPTEQILARQLVFLVRQVHAVAILLAFPYYAEQAGQLVRGLCELARTIGWLVAPDSAAERRHRAVRFWNDGIRQTRDKYDFQEEIGQPVAAHKWLALEEQEKLIADEEQKLGLEARPLPDARGMWKSLKRLELYGLFRWESDPAHGSSVSLGTVVAARSEGHYDLGGANSPRDRARRISATFLLLDLAGRWLVDGLGFDSDDWSKACEEVGADLSRDLAGLLSP